jgi:hypothetical protein
MSSEFVPFEVARPIIGQGLASICVQHSLTSAFPPGCFALAATVTRELRKLRLNKSRFAEVGLANGLRRSGSS